MEALGRPPHLWLIRYSYFGTYANLPAHMTSMTLTEQGSKADLAVTADDWTVSGRPSCAIGAQSAWRDGDDHVALLVTQVDVTVRIHNLIQRVATVDHRPKRAALGEFLQRQQV